jgi:nucleoid DNA-binding protein
MDEIIKSIVDKTGIPADKARTAVETVLGYIKDKLPTPVSAQIDNVVNTGGDDDITRGSKTILR